jgi:hypothetical protein
MSCLYIIWDIGILFSCLFLFIGCIREFLLLFLHCSPVEPSSGFRVKRNPYIDHNKFLRSVTFFIHNHGYWCGIVILFMKLRNKFSS